MMSMYLFWQVTSQCVFFYFLNSIILAELLQLTQCNCFIQVCHYETGQHCCLPFIQKSLALIVHRWARYQDTARKQKIKYLPSTEYQTIAAGKPAQYSLGCHGYQISQQGVEHKQHKIQQINQQIWKVKLVSFYSNTIASEGIDNVARKLTYAQKKKKKKIL